MIQSSRLRDVMTGVKPDDIFEDGAYANRLQNAPTKRKEHAYTDACSLDELMVRAMAADDFRDLLLEQGGAAGRYRGLFVRS